MDQDGETSRAQLPTSTEKFEITHDAETNPTNVGYQHNESEKMNEKPISSAFLTTESSNDPPKTIHIHTHIPTVPIEQEYDDDDDEDRDIPEVMSSLPINPKVNVNSIFDRIS